MRPTLSYLSAAALGLSLLQASGCDSSADAARNALDQASTNANANATEASSGEAGSSTSGMSSTNGTNGTSSASGTGSASTAKGGSTTTQGTTNSSTTTTKDPSTAPTLSLPKLPVPANVLALLKQLGSPAMLKAIEAASNGTCASELRAMQDAAMPLLNNPNLLAQALKNGSSPDLSGVSEQINAFVRCIVTAVPELGDAFGKASASVAANLLPAQAGSAAGAELAAALPLSAPMDASTPMAATAAVTAVGVMPVPATAYELACQLDAPSMRLAIDQAQARELCSAQLRSLQSVAPLLISDARNLSSLSAPRPGAEMRVYQSAAQELVQCMAKAAPDLIPQLAWTGP